MKLLLAIKFIAAIALSLVVVALFSRGLLEKPELAVYDWRLQNSYTPEIRAVPLVIVGITEGFEEKTGEPFSRKFYTQLLNILQEEGASVVGFDIFFPQITDEKTDREFIQAIEKSGNVVLPVFSPVRLSSTEKGIYAADIIRGSTDEFKEAAASLGHINTIPDGDQVIRRVPALLRAEGEIYPQLSLEMARIHARRENIITAHPGLSATKGAVPVNIDGSMYIRLLPPEETVKYFIPFADVLAGNYAPGTFRNKAVIIGQTIVGAKNADLVPTPWGTQFGVMLQAAVLHNALSGRYVYRMDRDATIFLLIFFGAVFGTAALSKSFISNALALTAFSALIIAVSFYSMRTTGLFIDLVPLLILSFACYLSALLYTLVNAIRKTVAKERAIKIMKDAEKEITNILHPSSIPGITEQFAVAGVEGTELIKKPPDITLRTMLASLGIEAGAFVLFSVPGKYKIIAQEGEAVSALDIEELTRWDFRPKTPLVINDSSNKKIRGTGIKNLLVLPVISHTAFTILGIFINKRAAPFSKTSFFSRDDITIAESLALQSIIAIQNAQLNLALQKTQKESIFRLSMAIEYRDRETGMHIHRVSEYSKIIALNTGLGENEAELIKNAMPLHDIGKIAIPDNILLKKGNLTPQERAVVEEHPVIGAKMLEGSTSLILKASEIIALYHHEKYDGTGYPFRLKGNRIPIYGRIAAIADVFDAMSSKRVYKEAINIDESIEFLKSRANTAFDPDMVQAFIKERTKIMKIQQRYQDKK